MLQGETYVDDNNNNNIIIIILVHEVWANSGCDFKSESSSKLGH